MPKIILDAVAVSSTDMARTIRFYTLLGFEFAKGVETQDHVEPITEPGAVRLMIDTASLMEKITGQAPVPANHSAFALLCEDPAHVDTVAKSVSEAGFNVVSPPWDAFWGQRYAIVSDPDGYRIDLFAPL